MAQQHINTGSSPNDGTGDPLRTAFIKTEENFTELFASGTFPFTGSAIITGSLIVTGSVRLNGSQGNFICDNIQASKVGAFLTDGEYIDLTSGQVRVYADNLEHIRVTGSENPRSVIINPNNEDIDFTVKGAGSANLIHANAGTNRVGIHTNSPQETLHVNGKVKADSYRGDLPTGDTGLSTGEFFITSSEYFGASAPYIDIICIKS